MRREQYVHHLTLCAMSLMVCVCVCVGEECPVLASGGGADSELWPLFSGDDS